MQDAVQLSLFNDTLSDVSDDMIIETKNGYVLTQVSNEADNSLYEYKIFNKETNELIEDGSFKASISGLDLSTSEYQNSKIRAIFLRRIWQDKSKLRDAAEASKKAATPTRTSGHTPGGAFDTSSSSRGYSGSSWSSYVYTPPKKSTGFLDKLNKSDTLVIHCQDRSTEMLGQIYSGKNWDVLRDGNIDKDELHQLLQSHDRIVCLGHGTGSGLINVQGGGATIGTAEAPFLKDKKLFVIWCNADKYFESHGIGNGQFITGNMPSETYECSGAGCGNISADLMLENITYWSKLCADVVERALSGDAAGAAKYVQDKYIEKYGDHPVTIYNAERTKVQGQPIQSMFDRYWGDMELMSRARYFANEYQQWLKDNISNETNDDTSDQDSTSDAQDVVEAFTGDVKDIDVNSIHPQQKDHDRAESLEFTQSYYGAYKSTFHGSGSPWNREAEKMAKLITDPIKLVRRAKAVLQRYGLTYEYDDETAVWTPFERRLRKLGFTSEQIHDILKNND